MTSKLIVVAVAAATFALPAHTAGWVTAITLGRLAVCLFVLLRAIAQRAA